MSFALAIPLIFNAATGLADLAAIDRQVAAFTGVPAGAPGGASTPVDRRLRLGACPEPLSLNWRTARRDSVVVQCPAAGGWRLFVPVGGNASGYAAAPAIERGDAVTISVAGEGFSVTRPGEALESGPIGAWIKVRTASNARTSRAEASRARVVRPGLVEIPLP
jgi:flagella basal body P-ring formation protein FlgA